MDFRTSFEREGHTLASMIRSRLFGNGATFAACVVTHPLNDSLSVTVKHPDGGKECLLDSLRQAARDLEQFKRAVGAKRAHEEAIAEFVGGQPPSSSS